MNTIVTLEGCIKPDVTELMELLKERRPKGEGGVWTLDAVKPSDLYCYLQVRFGIPNGIQNVLRNDSSDNLIHWEWTLVHPHGVIDIAGMNMRTEAHLIGDWHFSECDVNQFCDYLKREFALYGRQMTEFRTKHLEDWDMLVNPYKQLHNVVSQLKADLASLSLDQSRDRIGNYSPGVDLEIWRAEWTETVARYHRGVGLATALKTMTPVLAETFVNLLIFVLCRPEVRANERLYSAVVRANIDIRIQSLHLNCVGFKIPVDWSADACRKYNTIVNERNDVLHGNVSPSKLKFSEIFFLGRVPIFKQYENLWARSIGLAVKASGLDRVEADLAIVDAFTKYVLSCLSDAHRRQMEVFMENRDIGLNKEDKRLGILLPQAIVDMHPVFIQA